MRWDSISFFRSTFLAYDEKYSTEISLVCILVITSVLKIVSLIKGETILNETDTLIQMPYSAIQWMVGVVKVLVVLMLYSQTLNAWKGCALGCLGASFLVYRIFDMLSPDIFTVFV